MCLEPCPGTQAERWAAIEEEEKEIQRLKEERRKTIAEANEVEAAVVSFAKQEQEQKAAEAAAEAAAAAAAAAAMAAQAEADRVQREREAELVPPSQHPPAATWLHPACI